MLNDARHLLAPLDSPAEPSPEAITAPIPVVAPTTGRRRRLLMWIVPALPLAALVVVATIALLWRGVYPGVYAGSVDLGGTSRATAAARIAAEAARWDTAPITLTGPQGSAAYSRTDLGLHYDADATLANALAGGRAGSPFARLAAIVDFAWNGRDVATAFWVDEGTLRARVDELAGATDVQPRDGQLRIEGGRVITVAPIEGRGLDIEATVRLLIGAVAPAGPTALTLSVAEHLQPRVDATTLAAAQARAEAYLATPVALRGADLELRFDAATIGSWLTVSQEPDAAQPLTVAIDSARIRASVAPLAAQVYRDPRNAAYEYDTHQRAFVATVRDRDGRRLDVGRTVAQLAAALDQPGARVVAPATEGWSAAFTADDIAVANRQAANSYLAGPLVFAGQQRRWTIGIEQLAAWLTIQPGETRAAGPRLTFDDDALSDYIIALRGTIDRPAVDAKYTMDEGTDVYRVTGASQVGYKLDGPAAYRAAMVAVVADSPSRVVPLPIAATRPKVTEADVAGLAPERWIDVDLTLQRMYAVVGKKVVYTATISSGKKDWETPTGTYHILYRVENETMTSASIGAEEYYRLENVLYTQYFTYEGHALHYSWWKTPESFGTPSSHGCLSETLRDAEFFWKFADVGTRVTIHGKTPL